MNAPTILGITDVQDAIRRGMVTMPATQTNALHTIFGASILFMSLRARRSNLSLDSCETTAYNLGASTKNNRISVFKMIKPTIFISYSHKDEEWKNRLGTHLKVLENESIIEEWDDRHIGTGKDWYKEIEDAMERCSVAMLMVSANFLTSEFILTEEVPRLLERKWDEGIRIFPLIVCPCAWKQVKWLAQMKVRPTDGHPLSAGDDHQIDTDLAAITEEVADVIRCCAPPTTPEGYVPLAPDKISLAKMPSTNPDLFGRDEELAILDAAWDSPQTNIVELVAWGGVGKTALVNKWLLQMGKDNYRGAERVYGWSFYSQGAAEGKQASADTFIAAALAWFGDPDPKEGSPWDKGQRLAELVRRQRTLLILDGLEPLQYQPGEMEGRLKDPGLQSLLRELANYNPGLCVLTTRLAVDDLKDFTGTRVERIELENLSPEAGAELLSNLGVKGTPVELKQAASEFRGHALALTLLGSYLAVVYGGDIRQRDKIPRLTAEKKQGAHAIRVMKCYEEWFKGRPELDILLIMGLFDRPAEGGAVEAVRAKPAIKDLTSKLQKLSHAEWQYAVNSLRTARLLAAEDPHSPDTLDAHPLVREYFGERLKEGNSSAWKEAHSRLYDYYKSQAEEFPETIEEMAPLFAAVAHGCAAGRHEEVLHAVYKRRIQRGDYFATKNLGAHGADLAALSGYFDAPWNQPTEALTADDKGFVLARAGFELRALGRLTEATEPMEAALQVRGTHSNWANAAINASNLSQLYASLGDLAQALHYARQAVDFADRSSDPHERISKRSQVADVLHKLGRLEMAATTFREAEQLLKQRWRGPGSPFLYSLACYQYCDLLLAEGKHWQVLNQAGQSLEEAKCRSSLLDIALGYLSLGQAYLMQGIRYRKRHFSQATVYLDQAVTRMRDAGSQQYIPHGLLARAELYREQGEFALAHRDVDEAMRIAKRDGMRLHEADCHLGYARLHLAAGEKEKARESLAAAREMIKDTGYHRRDKEVKELEKQLKKS